MKTKVSVFWFRRDLRLEDNVGLYHALSSEFPIFPIFIFDPNILDHFQEKYDRRVDYIHQAIDKLKTELKAYNTTLNSYYDYPLEVFKSIAETYDIQAVYCNRDYEPKAIKRDLLITNYCNEHEIPFYQFKDQVIFDTDDILKSDGNAYTVFTPYAQKWKTLLSPNNYKSYQSKINRFLPLAYSDIQSLSTLGFEKTDLIFTPPKLDSAIIDQYEKYRDYPSLEGTTNLGIAIRFGTISIRRCVNFALKHNQTWLKELIWREFFMQILYHFPYVVTKSFKLKYDNIAWRNNEEEFKIWCTGKTGYPLVDAGIRELNQTGFMHNRIRMIAASFLCKHLLIDWRWGELYFAQKLNDYDLSANNGNWQWASGSGCDAAPYFRIFNPETQAKKFDKNLDYIKKWIPEFGTTDYPQPVVEHQYARNRALNVYRQSLENYK